MRSVRRQSQKMNDPPTLRDGSAEDLKLRTILQSAAEEAVPSAQLRARLFSSFERRTSRRRSSWNWLVPATACIVLIAIALVAGFRMSRVPNAPPASFSRMAAPNITTARIPRTMAEESGHQRARAVAKVGNPQRRPERKPAGRLDAELNASARFDSLLYCDRLSCGEPMQVIRLQVPVANVGRAYQSLARNGFMTAELVVGSDGVTRAVRIAK